jgi:hypothetical protein
MPTLPDHVTTVDLRSLTLSDLVAVADAADTAVVETFLGQALGVANEFLALHDRELADPPTAIYDRWSSGVTYDPYHDRGEVLVVGGPRGLLQGGEQVLSDRGSLTQKSLFTVLCKGLVHSHNQHLVDEHFERAGDGRSGDAGIDLYDRFRMLNPAVDEGIAQMFVLYLSGDVTDREFRQAYIEAWADWYGESSDLDGSLFRAVAYAVGDRIDGTDGDTRERFLHAFDIQRRLVRDGDVSVLRGYSDAVE